MDFGIIKSRIEGWLEPVLTEKNLFVVDIRFPGGRKVEVFVDSDEGIQISECASISRLLEKNLDGSGLVPDNYVLEVSSPGMDNPLKVPRQYKKRIGRVLEVLKNDGTMIEAQLEEADDEKIKLKDVAKPVKKNQKPDEPKEYLVKYEDIKKAVLQFKF